ncbi:MAG: hypothetical protein H6716_26770 [Polyangiaceae bacterium]|nr:hypothetical protein [Polyangiaceae bacterium]
MDNAEAHQSVLDQVSLYGLTTVAATARLATGGDRPAATKLLDALVQSGALHRHRSCYTTSPESPKPRDRWRDLSVLSYCCLGNHERPRITRERLSEALSGLAERLGVRPPIEKPCIFDRQDRLARLWVEPYSTTEDGMELGAVLEALQRAVSNPSFELWSYLALSGQFSLLILCRNRQRAEELGRWLVRVPLVGRAGAENVEIATSTAVIQ